MTPRVFFRTLLKGYSIVLVSLLVAIGIAVVYLVAQQTNYRSSSFVHVEVALPEDASADALAAAITYANYRTTTYKMLVATEPVLDPVIDREGLDLTANQLAQHVTAISAAESNVIEVRVTWPDRQQSAELANAIVDQLIATYSDESETIDVDLERVAQADASAAAVVPNPPAVVALAVFAGVLFSSAWLFVRRVRQDRAALADE